MSPGVIVFVTAAAAFALTLSRGVFFTFRWLYLPALFCIPAGIQVSIPGLPDLSSQKAIALGLVIAALLRGEIRRLVPRWSVFDTLVVAAVLSFSISYALDTELKGFVFRIKDLAMAWAAPYLLTRALVRDCRSLERSLGPLAAAMALTATLAIAESRLAYRFTTVFWNSLGAELRVLPHYEGFRWGYLRSAGPYSHPIVAGSVFVGAVPLMLVWGVLNPRRRLVAAAASILCSLACVASLSRGPLIALGGLAAGLGLFRLPRSWAVALLVVAAVCIGPFAAQQLMQEWKATDQLVQDTGNTATQSGRYRLAIFMVYGDKIIEGGLWGGLRSLHLEEFYKDAWSIDNSYVFVLLEGGWLGGGLFLAFVLAVCVRAVVLLNAPWELLRLVKERMLFAFLAISFCIANVWFAPDLASVFWVLGALTMTITNADRSASPGKSIITPGDVHRQVAQHTSRRLAPCPRSLPFEGP